MVVNKDNMTYDDLQSHIVVVENKAKEGNNKPKWGCSDWIVYVTQDLRTPR